MAWSSSRREPRSASARWPSARSDCACLPRTPPRACGTGGGGVGGARGAPRPCPDGSCEWVFESQRARAVFSTQDGGRWLEFTWKDGGVNFLPEQGLFVGPGRVDVRGNGDTLDVPGPRWER